MSSPSLTTSANVANCADATDEGRDGNCCNEETAKATTRNARNERRIQRRAELNQQQKQHTLNLLAHVENKSEHGVDSIRSKNARSKEFRDFLFATFPALRAFATVEEARRLHFQSKEVAGYSASFDAKVGVEMKVGDDTSQTTPDVVPPYPKVYVLDVAGGKGEIAVPLRIKGIDCGVVDPRADLKHMRKLMKFVDKSLNTPGPGAGAMMRRKLAERSEAMVEIDADGNEVASPSSGSACGNNNIAADATAGETKHESQRRVSIRLPDIFREWFAVGDSSDSEELKKAKLKCDVIIGMHPDQATEPIVDFALKNKKPFAIVPCCVFPKDNPHRRLVVDRVNGGRVVGITHSTHDGMMKTGSGSTTLAVNSDGYELEPVETYDQFIEYLKRKGDSAGVVIKTASLPIEGRSTILYCDGN